MVFFKSITQMTLCMWFLGGSVQFIFHLIFESELLHIFLLVVQDDFVHHVKADNLSQF